MHYVYYCILFRAIISLKNNNCSFYSSGLVGFFNFLADGVMRLMVINIIRLVPYIHRQYGRSGNGNFPNGPVASIQYYSRN